MSITLRERFLSALDGSRVDRPVYAVYDWFVKNRPQVNWPRLFELGLGQINHAGLMRLDRPKLQIVETTCRVNGQTRRDVRWITDIGELHEWYLGEWRQEHLIKTPHDYRIFARAFSDVKIVPAYEAFEQSETQVGDGGITIGCTALARTAFQAIQIDYAGLERFSIDIAGETPELMELIEQLNELTFREWSVLRDSPARELKLWENLSLETMGPNLYRRHLVPVYRRILELLGPSGKRLHMHYDGKLRGITADIAALSFDGVDSFTEPPEGDMLVTEARQAWPDKFLWLHPNLGWYEMPEPQLRERIIQAVRAAGPSRFCFMISEDIPPDWERTVPTILGTLGSL